MITKVINSDKGTASQIPLIPQTTGRYMKLRVIITIPRRIVNSVAGLKRSMAVVVPDTNDIESEKDISQRKIGNAGDRYLVSVAMITEK